MQSQKVEAMNNKRKLTADYSDCCSSLLQYQVFLVPEGEETVKRNERKRLEGRRVFVFVLPADRSIERMVKGEAQEPDHI